MIYSITSSIDATIYEQFETKNSGLDAVLQLEKIISSSKTNETYNSRILTKFDLTHISKSINSGDIKDTFVSTLKLYTHAAASLPYTYNLFVYAASQSWAMGIGKHDHNPKTTEGVSWKYRDGSSTGTEWHTSSVAIPFATGTTGSLSTQTNKGGATWWTGSDLSQTFTYESTDLSIDVTSIVRPWLSGSWDGGPVLDNDGFLIKKQDSIEYDGANYGDVNYFSKETHTIYQPRLQFAWDDFSPITASLSQLDIGADVFVYLKNNRDILHKESKERFRLVGRERFSAKTYATESAELTVKSLPTNSYWSLEDYQTGETVIDYDTTYTKISCDSGGNYFDLWLDQFELDRRYKVVIKSVSGSITKVFDNDLTFKVVD